jgi:hypothetical protein
MSRIILALLLACVVTRANADPVWAQTNASGAVTGFYANAAPVPAPAGCCTVMDSSDARVHAFLNPPAVAAPTCVVTSTGTPTLSGSYAAPNAEQQRQITAITLYTQVNTGKFPGGSTSFPWPDASGTPHTFTTSAEWLSFASATADCTMAYTSGQVSFAETIP